MRHHLKSGIETSKYACFDCRRTFKRASAVAPALCPECGEPMTDMGREFVEPSSENASRWRIVASLHSRSDGRGNQSGSPGPIRLRPALVAGGRA